MNRPTRSSLLVFSIVCAFSAACGKPVAAPEETAKTTNDAAKPSTATASQSSAAPDKVAVYYFHGTRRCPTCLGIQKALEETIEDNFSKEVDAGLLMYEELNFEEEKNRALVEKLSVAFSTMIVATKAGETLVQWENADKLWDLAHDKDALKAYVNEKIRASLKLIGAV